jgi:Ni,Fe-hydrogenase I small subunit
MVRITRRDFLKYCAMSAGALGLSASTLMRLESVLAKTDNGAPAVVWIAGAACTGCTMSMINEVFYTTIDDVLINEIDLKFIDTLQAAAGDQATAVAQAVYAATDPFVLVVEGAIQTATPPGGTNAGDYCRIGNLTGDSTSPASKAETMLYNVQQFANKAAVILSVGTCSSFGGVPGALGNVTGAKGVAFSGTSLGGAIIGNGENSVSAISMKADGSGYDDGTNALAPDVIFDNTGTGATTSATATASATLGVTSIAGGTGGLYDLRPVVDIDPPAGAGRRATAQAEFDRNLSPGPWPVTGITVTYKGTNYTGGIAAPPNVTITRIVGDTQTSPAAAATATVSGYVTGISVVNGGKGYTSAPAVVVAVPPGYPATGSKAEAAAVMDFGGTKDSVKYRTGLAQKLINISGCPPHPDWIIGTLGYVLDYLPALLNGTASLQQLIPPLNRDYQPIDFGYGTYQCNAGPCPWRYNNTNTAATTGRTSDALAYNRRYPQGNSRALGIQKYQGDDLGCLGILGCKGRKTKADCSARRWNADGAEQFGVNWCVGSRGGCHGCTSPAFPDKVGKFFTFA